MKITPLLVMAVVPCLHAATPLVTQYISPVDAPSYENAIYKSEYGTGKGITFSKVVASDYGDYINYYINIGTHHLVAWSKWVKFIKTGIPSNNADSIERTVVGAGKPGRRYLYPVQVVNTTSGRVYNRAGLGIKGIESLYSEDPQDVLVIANNLDTVSSDAVYVQCVHTDWVYQVTFDANGGAGSMDPNPFVYTNSASLPSNAFVKTGHRFSYWNTKDDGSGTRYDNNDNVSSSVDGRTLYAQWEVNNYTVKFNRNASDATGSMGTQNFIYGQRKELSECLFSRPGYAFAGWATDPDGSVVYGNMEEVENLSDLHGAQVNLYAKWTGNEYRVLFSKSSAEGITGNMDPQIFTYGEPQALSSNRFVRTGWAFQGWSTVQDGSVEYRDGQVVSNLTVKTGEDAKVTLHAIWNQNQYLVTLDQQGGSGGTNEVLATYGEYIPNVPPPAKDGYSFIGYWSESDGGERYIDSNGNGTKKWEISSDRTIYARWSEIFHPVSFHANGGTFENEASDVTIGDKYHLGLPYEELPLPLPSTNTLFFAGWWTSTDSTNRTQVTESDVAVESVTDLYARWKTVPKASLCTLTFSWGGNVVSTNAVIGTEFGLYFPSPSPTDAAGRVVFGWYDDDGKRVLETDLVKGDEELTPTWTVGEFNDLFNCRDIQFSTLRAGYYAKQSISKWLYKYDLGNWVDENGNEEKSGGNPLDYGLDKWSVAENMAQSGAIAYSPGGTSGFSELRTALIIKPATSGWLSLELKTSCGLKVDTSLDLYTGDYPPHGDGVITNLCGVMDDFVRTPERHIDAGEEVKLEYYRADDLENYGGDDCGWARNLTWIPDREQTTIDDWESFASVTASVPGAVWTTGGVEPWATVETNKAFAAAGLMDSDNGGSSWVRLDVPASAGVLEFEWRVSGETGYFDTNGVYQVCDCLEFLDESQSSPYRLVLEGLTNGFAKVVVTNDIEEAHVFIWRYVKDGGDEDGDDGAWLRNVVWTPNGDEPTETVVVYEYEENGVWKQGSVAVPNSWVEEYDLIGVTGVQEGDYYAALTNHSGKVGRGGVQLSYWADYIAGTVPTNSASQFKITGISVENGTVYLTWDPDWSDPAGEINRLYTVWGKTNLTDAVWHTPTNSASRFFAVEVGLPNSDQ